MRLRKPQRPFGSEINIAPLIDVVFLLIIFFMTVTQFAHVELEDAIEPPEARPPADNSPLPGRLVVNVHADGRIVVLGQTRTQQQLDELLTDLLKGRQPGDVSVLVRGDRRLPWRTAASILSACSARGINRVRVATVKPDG